MKKIITAVLILTILTSTVFTSLSYSAKGNITYPYGVTDEMTEPSYWYDKALPDENKVLMRPEQIEKVTQDSYTQEDNMNIDLSKMSESFDADSLSDALASFSIPGSELYIDGELIDNDSYFSAIREAINTTSYSGEMNNIYGICTKYAEMRSYPINGITGYSPDDTDDEFQVSALSVNEPVVIRQKCEIKGETFYYCISSICTGWVNGNNLAICKDKAQWLDSWQVNINSDDFIVVTQDKIVTEKSVFTPYASEVKLTIGTILKLVPTNEMPALVGERNTWNNYVVYLPVRDSQGNYEKKPALISQHNSVSTGFLPFTQKNLLNVSFSCLGNRYGWGGMLDSMDCSLYTRMIYRCFGFDLPRNTTWQQMIPNTHIDVSAMSDTDKKNLIKTMPAGTLLYFSGHTMVYVGTHDDTNYAISDLGTVVESVGDISILNAYSVVLNPLTVRRGSGITWLTAIDGIVLTVPDVDIKNCTIKVERNCKDAETKVNVSYNGMELYEGVNYTVNYGTNSITVKGINNFTGEATADIITNHNYKTTVKKATLSANGSVVTKCADCNSIKNSSTIYKPSVIKIAKTSYTYTGKVITPAVTVKDSKGKALKKGTDYTLSYSKNRKSVGNYSVKVSFRGNYSGSKTLSFKICPKPTKISKLTPKSKSFVAKWKKQSKETSGYEIQYSTRSNFKSKKVVTVSVSSKTSCTVKSLKAKTKYFVRIRTYKNLSGKKIYSSFTNTLSVKTK